MTTKKKLGQILLEAGVLDEYQLKSALGFQKKWGGRLGHVLVENRFITEEVLIQAIQQQTGIAAVQLSNRTIPDYLVKLVPLDLAEKHHLIPIGLEGEPGNPSEALVVATSDPTNLTALDELRFKTGKRIKPVLAGERSIENAIAVHYRGEAANGMDFDIDPEGIQFGGPEMEAAALDDDLVLVQGTLEDGPASSPSGEDPFAELEALGAPPPAEAVPPPAAASGMDDPFADLDALGAPAEPVTAGGPHPAATALDFDLDGPSEQAAADGGDILEEIEIVEDFENLDADEAPALDPSPPAPDSDVFGEPNSDLQSLDESGLDDLPDLEQPVDLSGVPDLEPADPTPVMPAPGPPASMGLDNLPDLEPDTGEEDIPTIQGQQVSTSPFAQDDDPGESTADLLLDGEDLDLDAVLDQISESSQADQDHPPTQVQATQDPPPKPADQKPKPDSVPTQVIAMSELATDGESPEAAALSPALSLADDPQPAAAPGAPASTPDLAPSVSDGQAPAEAQTQSPSVAAGEAITDPESAGGGKPEEGVKSEAMKALLSRVGLSKGKPSQADGSRPPRPGETAGQRAGADEGARDGTLAALVRLMIKKGLISAEELQQELEGD